MFPGEHIDDVHLPWIPVIGTENVRHGLLERFAEKRILHENNGGIIGNFPLYDAGGDGFDYSGPSPMTKVLDITACLGGEPTVDLDADDSLVRQRPCNK